MSVTTICQVCGAATARHTCEGCGSSVCPDHYDAESSLCTVCAARARGGGGRGDVGPDDAGD